MQNITKEFADKCLIVLTAGGESSRFKSVTGSQGIHKAAFKLPNGDTMIERTIRLYKDLGFKNFLILLYYHSDSIKELLGDGSKMGINITYSHDPEKPIGRGGAMKNALVNGHIPPDTYIVIHNPDDQIVGDSKKILKGAIDAHVKNEEKNALATAVLVEGTKYDFTGFGIEDDFVTSVEMYPFVKIPTHIGLTIFSPKIVDYFDRLFDATKKTDFEAVLFPVLKDEKRLAAHIIPSGSWVSVNDEKGLKKLIKELGL